jgi:hypothetical protein
MADLDEDLTEDEEIVQEAQKRFEWCESWEANSIANGDNDEKFAAGDDINNYQWPQAVYLARNQPQATKPCLTINKTRQHCLQIINDARQHKQGIKIVAVGDGADYDAAQAYMGMVRAIERDSNAQAAYDTATRFQVYRGIGYFRVLTKYASDGTMDQDIVIQRVPNPKMIYLDPDIQQMDGSDARFGFVFRDMPRDEFEAAYPKYKDSGSSDTFGTSPWDNEHHVRVCEYYRKTTTDDELLALHTGEMVKRSEAKGVKAHQIRASRPLEVAKIEHYLICGNRIVECKPWAGKYVPICRVLGEETIIDNQLDRKGHVRQMRSAQQSLNYYTSSAIEFVALQTKSPFVGDARAFEGYQNYWTAANTQNFAFLPYNATDPDTHMPIERPQRADPPEMPQAYIEGLKIAQQEMMLVSGQYQAIMGEASNETSGKAINARQRQGDNATYHYIDHLAAAIRFAGEIIVDLIPHIYDVQRVMRIIQQDGEESDLIIDPQAPQAHAHVDPQGQQMTPAQVAEAKRTKGGMDGVRSIFNPMMGRYGVASDVGPAYATQRQETFNGMMQMVGQDHALMPIVGDLMWRASDLPMAEEIAERLHNMVPPQALGGPSMEEQKMNQHISQQDQLIKELQSKLADKGIDAGSEAKKLQIQEFDSETKRMAAIGALDPEAMIPIIRQMVHEAMGMSLPDMQELHGIQPMPGPQDQFNAENAPQQETVQ